MSETKIPTPLFARTSISFSFLTSPESLAYIPIDLSAIAPIDILALFTAVEYWVVPYTPSAYIPIPLSSFRLIPYSWPTIGGLAGIFVLFSIYEPSLANIPIDSLVLTLIIPLSLLIAVEFILAKIPIFSVSVLAVPFKFIVPVFSAFTFSLVIAAELFINIIPTELLLSILIVFLFNKVNVELASVTRLSTIPYIPADSLFFISIRPFTVSEALSALSLVPDIFLRTGVAPCFISTNIPADFLPSIVIFFLFVALLFLAYIPADSSFLVVIEATRFVLIPVFSIFASSPYIPADFSSSIRIVPLFMAEAWLVLTNIPTDSFFLVVIFPVNLLLGLGSSTNSLIKTVFLLPTVVPNIPTDFSSFNKIWFLFISLEFSPAIAIESFLLAVILPSLVRVDSFLP